MVGILGFGFSACCGEAARSGNIAPILAATLPLLLVVSPSCCLTACAGEGSGLRSGLPAFGFGDVLLRTKAPFSLLTGEVGRLPPTSAGVCSEVMLLVAPTSRCVLPDKAEAAARPLASMCVADLTSGEEVVR